MFKDIKPRISSFNKKETTNEENSGHFKGETYRKQKAKWHA